MKSLFLQLFYGTGEELFGTIRSFFITVLAARFLTLEDYGIFALAISIRAILFSINQMGLDRYVIANFDESDQHKKSLITIIQLKIFLALFTIITTITFLGFKYTGGFNYQTLCYTIIIVSIVFCPFDIYFYLNKAKRTNQGNSKAKLMMLIFALLSRLVLIDQNSTLIIHSLLILFDYLVLYFVVWMNNRSLNQLHISSLFKFDLLKIKEVLIFSLPLGLASFLFILKNRVDLFLIAKYLSLEDVGIYSSFSNLYMLSTLGLTVMTVVLLPYYKNKKLNRDEISTVFSSLLIIYSMFVAVIILILGDEILLLIFGKKYLAAINLLKTSTLSLFLLGLGAIRTMHLISKKQTLLLFKIQIIIVSIIIVLLTIFIPKYGLKGAVYVMIIGQFSSSILINLVWKETRELLKLQFDSLRFYTHINKLSKTI